MVRVSHHVIDPTQLFKDIYRSLQPGGFAIIEVASNAHFINRMKRLAKLKSPSKTPIRVGSVANGITDDTPFVNHNPNTIKNQLIEAGFKYEKKLSVSNLRSSFLKKHLKAQSLAKVEKHLQAPLATISFGPSIFILVKK